MMDGALPALLPARLQTLPPAVEALLPALVVATPK